ncbi:MAG: hypothetical protein ACE3JK_01805 [Sporolactobacillus sp.]
MIDVVVLVKFNADKALVLKDKLDFVYEKFGNILIGTDASGLFHRVLIYGRPSEDWKAFGGWEFDLNMKDGSITHCDGQWWDGGRSKARQILKKELVDVTLDSIAGLKRCYVFSGGTCIDEKDLALLISDYHGKVYEYREYEQLLKEGGTNG